MTRRLCRCVALLAALPSTDAAFCQRGGKGAVTCEGSGANKMLAERRLREEVKRAREGEVRRGAPRTGSGRA